jgi:ATP/maltotriose-dependent transcriptional regulator MalT
LPKLGEIKFKIDPYLALLTKNNLRIQPLTIREIDILKSINKGFSIEKIVDEFFISKNTVKYHIRNIYSKAGVNNRKGLEEKVSFITAF